MMNENAEELSNHPHWEQIKDNFIKGKLEWRFDSTPTGVFLCVDIK